MQKSLVQKGWYQFGSLSSGLLGVGVFVLCGLVSGGCESTPACTRCINGYYPSDPSQECSACKACPEMVTDASPSNIAIWCQNTASRQDADTAEVSSVDGLGLNDAD